MIYNQNLWYYGEVNDRLTALRETDIYQKASKTIHNLTINELGGLKIMKSLEQKSLPETGIITAIKSKFDSTMLFYSDKIIAVNLEFDNKTGITNYTEIARIDLTGITIDEFSNINVSKENIFIVSNGVHKIYKIENANKSTTGIVENDQYFKYLQYPTKEKEIVTYDVYRYYVEGGTKTLAFIYRDDNPTIKLDTAGVPTIASTGIVLSRIYTQFKAGISKDDIDTTNMIDGEYIAVMTKWYNSGNAGKDYYINDKKITMGTMTSDTVYKGDYFMQMTPGGVDEGMLYFGIPENPLSGVVEIGEFQSRTFIMNNEKIYFSTLENKKDFRNGVGSADSFYIEPTQINNTTPNLLRVKIGREMWISTDLGIYCLSYTNVFAPTSVMLDVATDIGSGYNLVLLEGILYFIDIYNKMKALEKIGTNSGQAQFARHTVESYLIDNKFESISKVIIGGVDSILAKRLNHRDKFYVYDYLGEGAFRKISFDSNGITNPFTINELIFDRNTDKYYKFGTMNAPYANITLLPPILKSKNTGSSFLTDYYSKVERVTLKVLNEGNNAVKRMTIAGVTTSNLTSDPDATYSVYDVKTRSVSVNKGVEIYIETNENEKELELLGVEQRIKVNTI